MKDCFNDVSVSPPTKARLSRIGRGIIVKAVFFASGPRWLGITTAYDSC